VPPEKRWTFDHHGDDGRALAVAIPTHVHQLVRERVIQLEVRAAGSLRRGVERQMECHAAPKISSLRIVRTTDIDIGMEPADKIWPLRDTEAVGIVPPCRGPRSRHRPRRWGSDRWMAYSHDGKYDLAIQDYDQAI